MGVWSHEPFGNDTACDWSHELLESTDLAPIESALDAVLNAVDQYLDADLASEAIAAAEVLAKLLGQGTQTDSYTKDIDQWIIANPLYPNKILLEKGKQSLERIASPESELLELWEDSGNTDAWMASLKKLTAAIGA
ncbi:MAG: DUF4259 domain-containing protein [Leptothrix sp. (in: b-proteobacteria)]